MPDLSMENRQETPRQILIARERWDFNQHPGYEGCPDEELKYCFVYEFARDSDDLQAAISNFRASDLWPEMILADKVYWRRGLPYISFLKYFPEFPATPWLQIEKRLRTERIAALPEYDPPISLVSEEQFRARSQGKKWTPRQRCTTERLRINWAYSTDALTEAFARWAQRHRPSDFPEDQTHGRTDERDWLKKLGAKRLLEAFGSYKDASEHTEAILTDTNGGERIALYMSAVGWKRAAKEAVALIEGKYPEGQALRLISKVGFRWLPTEQSDRFFQWIGNEKVGVLNELLKLPLEESRARIEKILKGR